METQLKTLPLLPLREIVIFPNTVVPLFIGRAKSILAIEKAYAGDKIIFLSAQKDAKIDNPTEEEIYKVGTICRILQLLKLPDGTLKILVEGLSRGRIIRFLENVDFFMVEVEPKTELLENDVESIALFKLCKESLEEYSNYNKKLNLDAVSNLLEIEDIAEFSDRLAAILNLKLEQKQKLLETISVKKRLEILLNYLRGEIEVIKTEARIRERVKKQMEKTQRDYYLQEQMKAIQKELGEREDGRKDLAELEKRIKKKKLPKEVAAIVRKEFNKLSMMSPMSAEATVVRNYIDWLLSLPWYEKTKDNIDLEKVEFLLNKNHYGLEKPKQRIIEHLAVQKLTKSIKGPILCFVGPPGVGKTSLAKSIAEAIGRRFVRISLGGVRDEAEIRGHRRTYVGALPGKIIQGMRKAGTINPVFCLDEVDKIGMDFRGDPAAALLEVLDPEQNFAFQDHYLEVPYDLSKVLFITTANSLYTIPAPLLDRMEIIEIPGYTEEEKLEIARNYLLPRQLSAHGLKPEMVPITEKALLEIIRRYTREAGVRNLEREIANICRKIAREVAKNPEEFKPIKIGVSKLEKFLGVPKYRYGIAEEKPQVGIATGLAWTETGGALLQIEAVIMPGKGNLQITGKLGEVMQESVQAAMSYVRSRALQLGLPLDFYRKIDIHVHVPEGAIPKDGPSAGITIATAIVSALLKIPVKNTVAMTGEITLRGRVLPIGGLKEKLLAAIRGGIKTVLIPKENEKDLKEINPKILKNLEVILVDNVDEVLKLALDLQDSSKLFKEAPTLDVWELVDLQQKLAEKTIALEH
ncbi:MAG: Lon protease [Thermodesulfobacterium sp. 37_54]|uniref:endopeptidase La n=1 Tax=Thermodesulfobacterium commune TaxID=1741 RepID=UPI0007482385|nr:MAG: Lon protease [Thermodesulfobacterium sp. 37_54]KUK19762.1 MAG: Lon protease [Thermodesulfobacterium commune]HBT04356.1 endopeptidase La [Thermodesulfobacterium commune]HCP10220.1 endopeptidase La [Thermodesulfobacterium commune]